MNPTPRYYVTLRRPATGEEHTRLVFAADEKAASERAVTNARKALETAAEREYEPFEVLSCELRR